VVFEMLTDEQAARVSPQLLSDREALQARLDWDASGWPDFAIYYPIFAALGEARVYGAAVSRQKAREASADVIGAFGPDAPRFGLDRPLPEDQQTAREAAQMSAHCDALPSEMLPMMVAIQRLRDARLAQVALQALGETGGPVAVVTGNGHARKDWGAPALLSLAAPDVTVWALGQGEGDDPPLGEFDALRSAPAPEREDPCAAFAKQPDAVSTD
uniref:ChaN family lipoprotein n=1 Tax=Primorskyibacter sedentarius TaxID=745311 RepID=UPI003EBB2B3B